MVVKVNSLKVIGLALLFCMAISIFSLYSSAAIILDEPLTKDAIFGSDGTCGRMGNHLNQWCDSCNGGSFRCSGPGGCDSATQSCYLWQPSGAPKVIIDKTVNLPSAFNGKLTVITRDYGGGSYEREQVDVLVNGVLVGTTQDHACNSGTGCSNEGPFSDVFSNVNFRAGNNFLSFYAVDNGGSVSVKQYIIEGSMQVCGNNLVEPPEQCEQNNQCNDNNQNTIDTCTSCQCKYTPTNVCGDGVVISPEQCEYNTQCNDNNAATTDTCESCQCRFTPRPPTCGNTIIEAPEECENNAHCNDFNDNTLDVCTNCVCSNNPRSSCGNGVVEAPEQCEQNNHCNDNNPNTIDTCQSCQCKHEQNPPICGNGRVESPEQCEYNTQCNDNNAATTDICQSCHCKHEQNPPICGNGRIEPQEQCEFNNQCNDNNPNTLDTCISCACKFDQIAKVCGNGVVESPEQCERNSDCNDNNPSTIDSCVSCKCVYDTSSFCGDGIINNNEACEPKTSNNNQYCTQGTSTCSGKKTGLRDSYGYCGLSCNCIDDQYSYTCLKGSCGATCTNDADCSDNNPNTRDACDNNCGCVHETLSFCGNGRIDSSEQCESNSDCSPGKFCSQCRCVLGAYCGDSNVDSGESCDYGVKINGIPCVAPTNGTCRYCTANCSWSTLTGGSCGNYKIEYKEECDEGTKNGALCTSRCDDYCTYCRDNCKIGFVNGPECFDNYTIPYPPGVIVTPIVTPICTTSYCGGYDGYDYGYTGVGPRAGICGDGLVSVGEECDFGYDNGIACSPSCNGDCKYCSANCEEIVIQGSPCVRTARPWDPVNLCKATNYQVAKATLDTACDGNGKDVTREVSSSDNVYAKHGPCKMNATYIYFTWKDIAATKGIRNTSVVVEHFEENADLRIEYFNGSHWLSQCSIPATDRDLVNSCQLKGIVNYKQIDLRARIVRTSVQSYENIDHIYLSSQYCPTSTTCGNGKIDQGEGCDDGNTMTGDGCDEYCGRENMLCGEWGECLDGSQTQICYYGNLVKTNMRNCSGALYYENFLVIFLVFLLILIFLLFLFFPVVFYALKKK